MGNDKEFGLGPVDGITQPPAAGNLPAVLIVSAVIRMHSAHAGATIAPGRDGTTEHSVTFLITFHCRAESFHNADRLVPDGKARSHRILSFADINVASTYRGSGYPTQSVVSGANDAGWSISNQAHGALLVALLIVTLRS